MESEGNKLDGGPVEVHWCRACIIKWHLAEGCLKIVGGPNKPRNLQ